MSTVLTVAAALCLTLAWALLYLNSERTRAQLQEAGLRYRLAPAVCRTTALALASAALTGCTLAQGLAMGSLLWTALLCATAYAQVGLATWAPHWPLRCAGWLRRCKRAS